MIRILTRRFPLPQELRQQCLPEEILCIPNISTIKGLLENVSEDGKVMNVSGGTAVMRDKEGYRGIPKAYIQGWGQGLALAFFSTLLISDEITKDGAL